MQRTAWKYKSVAQQLEGKVCPQCGGEPYLTKSKIESFDYACKLCYREKRKRSRLKHYEKNLTYDREYNKSRSYYYDEKISARRKAQWAVRSGKIKRQPCACGSDKSEMHHEDYSKPLEVTWMCRKCHNREHTERHDVKAVPTGMLKSQ